MIENSYERFSLASSSCEQLEFGRQLDYDLSNNVSSLQAFESRRKQLEAVKSN